MEPDMTAAYVTLPRDSNQALGIGQFAVDFLGGKYAAPAERVYHMVERLHTDSLACAVSALALGTNAPRILRQEALEYACPDPSRGVPCFGSNRRVWPEKAVLANCAAVREWDANGTNFGYNPARGHTRGEFGHTDFYPVAVAAAQLRGLDGRQTLRAMLLLDEIRARLAEVFALRNYGLDHVVHGAIASAAVYAAVLGATPEQIESAIGLVVTHYNPFRAMRAGAQLSDSKGASAALSAEVAVLSARRAMNGFAGPADVFRNPKSPFCVFEPPPAAGTSPFELIFTCSGEDFAVMDMHVKLGLYEYQSAGAIHGLIKLLRQHPGLLDAPERLTAVRVTIYEPAYSIIADAAKHDPRTRQSADHSLPYIVATILRKAFDSKQTSWQDLMLLPPDYDDHSLLHPLTRSLMARIELRHGGPEYDARYPDGVPTTIELEQANLGWLSSGLIMYPIGHARNTDPQTEALLAYKFHRLARLGVTDAEDLHWRCSDMLHKSPEDMAALYDFELAGQTQA
jgi:2-methylcitrate dehydratase